MIPGIDWGVNERWLLYGLALGLSIAAGLFVASVDYLWVVASVGVMVGLVMVSSRIATLWFVMVTGFVVTGLTQIYLPDSKYFKYLPMLAAGGLLLHVASDWLAAPRRGVPVTVPLLFGFMLVGMVSLVANWSGPGMAVIGLKTYYPMWALFLALALIRWQPRIIDSIPRAGLVLAVLQLPFVAHQFLFLAPLREGIPDVVPVDIVAGTFGGDMSGGGANAVLSLFLITVTACLLGVWRHGAVQGLTALPACVLLLVPVALNSSRAALLYVPVVFGVIFFSDLVRRPVRALTGLLVMGLVVVTLLAAFTAADRSPGVHDWKDFAWRLYDGQLASERERSDRYSGLSRVTVLSFWADHHTVDRPVEWLIGHGPGATRVSSEGMDLAETLAERRFGGRQIGYTAVAALLWETGVLGLGMVLAMFWAAFRQAGYLARTYAPTDRLRAGIAQGLRAAVLVLGLSLAHKDFFVFHVPFQTLLACVFGYLAAQVNLVDRQVTPRREAAWKPGGPG